MVVTLGVVLVAGVVSEATARLAHEGLHVRVALSEARVIVGEEIVATVEVENRKPLPLTWCDLRVALPEGVEPADAIPG